MTLHGDLRSSSHSSASTSATSTAAATTASTTTSSATTTVSASHSSTTASATSSTATTAAREASASTRSIIYTLLATANPKGRKGEAQGNDILKPIIQPLFGNPPLSPQQIAIIQGVNRARNKKSIIVAQLHSPFSSVMVPLRRRRRNGRRDALLGDCRLQLHPFVSLPQLFFQVVHGNDRSGLVRHTERGFLDRFRFERGRVFFLIAICDQKQLLVPLFCCRLVLESEIVLGVRLCILLDLAVRNHFERAVTVALNQHVCSVENV